MDTCVCQVFKQTRDQFHQHFTSNICSWRSQKRKKTVKSSVSFWLFRIFSSKSCSLIVGEIETWRQFHQRARFSYELHFSSFFIRMWVYVKKAAETTFVRKTRAFNVDEIDTCCKVANVVSMSGFLYFFEVFRVDENAIIFKCICFTYFDF